MKWVQYWQNRNTKYHCARPPTVVSNSFYNKVKLPWVHEKGFIPLYSCPQTPPGCPQSLCRSGCSPHSELSSACDEQSHWSQWWKTEVLLKEGDEVGLTFWMVPLRLRIIISTLWATSCVCLCRSNRTVGSIGGISAGLRVGPRLL